MDASLIIIRSPSLKNKTSEAVEKQMKIKDLSHRKHLTCDIDRCFCGIINKARPNPTDVISKVLPAIKALPQKIGHGPLSLGVD